MRNEKEKPRVLRMPENAYEQLVNLPDKEVRRGLCLILGQAILGLMDLNGIKIEKVTVRAKTAESMWRKIERRKSEAPLRDIYGIRLLTEEPDRMKIKDLIQKVFPLTPGEFADGTPSFREYADPETRRQARERNKRISERHSAMHINIVFLREGSPVYDIAEIQVLNNEEMKIFEETRGEYKNGKN